MRDMINMHDFSGFIYLAVNLLFITVMPSLILLGISRVILLMFTAPSEDERTHPKLAFWKKVLLGSLGGMIGEITAVAVYHSAESSWCRDMSAQGSYCDGQGIMVLFLTVPLGAILGGCISVLWTWYSLLIRATKPWASIFSYCGGNRALNLGFAAAVPIVYWAIFALAMYRLTRNLL